MTNVCVLNLEYSFLSVPALPPLFKTTTGLWRQMEELSFIDNLPLIIKAARSFENDSRGLVVVAEPQLDHPLITVAINGLEEFIKEARKTMLAAYSQTATKLVVMLGDEYGLINGKFTNMLNNVCNHHHLEATICQSGDDEYVIDLFGFEDAVTSGETLVRVLVDCVINDWLMDAIEIDLLLIPIIGGVELFNFSQVARQANSNIYVPDLLPNVYGTMLNQFRIWFTAPTPAEILLTRDLLQRVIDQRTGLGLRLMRKEIDFTRVSLDMITLYNQLALFGIMFKYGVYISLPPLGGDNRMVVQGCLMHAINDAVNDINLLASNFYQVRILYFAPVDEYMLLQLMRGRNTVAVVANQYGLDIMGLAEQVRQMLIDLSDRQYNQYTNVRLRVELALLQREFILGKKNGKLIKILNQLNQLPMFKFAAYNGQNFYLDLDIVDGTNLLVMTRGLDLLELELPAELKFNVPEVFHKSIIGNGGTIIQLIMKKHNVFIKFSSTSGDDYARNVYLLKRAANVLIKCPRKNSANISLVQKEIDALVVQCSNTTNYHTETLKLLRLHYLLMINTNKLRAIHELEQQFGSYIDFPTSLLAFDASEEVLVSIKGTELKTKQCLRLLLQMMPKNYEFCIPALPRRFAEHFAGTNIEFNARVVIPFKVQLGVEVVVNHTPLNCDLDDHQIILSYFDEYAIWPAVNDLTQYLREKKFSILEKKPYIYDAKRQRRPAPPQQALPVITSHIPTNTLLKPSQMSQMLLPFQMPVRQPIW